jgi:hypothetical protein
VAEAMADELTRFAVLVIAGSEAAGL